MPRRDHGATAPAASQARSSRPAGRDVREAIIDATRELLSDHQFSELSVADILTAAQVARGSFYFYFESKHDVLAELVRRAVTQGHEAAQPWLSHPADKTAALRAGIAAGASVWRANAPVLRAIVENWRADPQLTALWLDQMQSFTDATVTQISADAEAAARLTGPGITAAASALTWLGERLYYLAACGIPPFDDESTLIATLLHVWTSVLYGDTGPSHPAPRRPRRLPRAPRRRTSSPSREPKWWMSMRWLVPAASAMARRRGTPMGMEVSAYVSQPGPFRMTGNSKPVVTAT